jgi:beta-N-acetylhexosaminidase
MKNALLFCMIAVFFGIVIKFNTSNSSDDWAHATLHSMTLRQKIGQLFMVATASSFEQPEEALASLLLKCPYRMDHDYIEYLIREYHIGGIVFLFKGTPDKQIDLTNHLQSISRIPLLIGQDCEWGLSMRLYETIRFPKNMTLGAIDDVSLIHQLGYEIGKQCKAIGVHINFAPVVDVNVNPENPVINDRSFGESPVGVARKSVAYLQGLQEAGILACAKHYPGHGDTAVDSHVALPIIRHAKERLEAVELLPFKTAIEAKITAIMTAHIVVPSLSGDDILPATFSPKLLCEILRHKLNFKGLIITDGLGMKALTDYYKPGEIELNALLAGNDILLCPLDVPKAVELIEQALTEGRITEKDIDERVLKVLTVKEKQGLKAHSTIDKSQALSQLHTQEAYRLKKDLFTRAITLVKGDDVMPLRTLNDVKAIVINEPASGIFSQQLRKNGIEALSSTQKQSIDTQVLSDNGIMTVIVGLFGMNKFSSQRFGVSDATLELLNALKNSGKKVILAIFGNPYSLSLFQSENVVIMAYEDDVDSQQAVIDVLTGHVSPTGKLPVTAIQGTRTPS